MLGGGYGYSLAHSDELLNVRKIAGKIANAERVGTALKKNDTYHRAGSFLTKAQLSKGHAYYISQMSEDTVHSCFFDNSRHIFLLKNIMKIWHIIPAPIVARTLNIYNSNQSIGDHLPALEPRYFMSSLV